MSEIRTCRFCNEQAEYIVQESLAQNINIKCPNCGHFSISDYADKFYNFKAIDGRKFIISGLIREKQELGLSIGVLDYDDIDKLLKDSLIPNSFSQKIDKILLYIYKKLSFFGDAIIIGKIPYSVGYARNRDEFNYMIEVLEEYSLIKIVTEAYNYKSVTITSDGIQRVEELTETNKLSNNVFVAMGFKSDLLEAHRNAIKPACKECGFDAILVSDIAHNNDINFQIIASIKSSKFVIVDFTYNNEGAYFEAGFAQGFGLQVIRTCNKSWFEEDELGQKKNHLHFDINHYNFILWEDIEDYRNKLIANIKANIL